MSQNVDIYKSGGVLVKDRKFLVVREKGKDVFVAPGGKLDPGETSLQALVREMMEEVQITISESDVELFGTFYAQAAGNESKTLKMDVYLIHNYQGEISPAAEIEEMMWIDTSTTGVLIGSIFEHDVMPKLKSLDLID